MNGLSLWQPIREPQFWTNENWDHFSRWKKLSHDPDLTKELLSCDPRVTRRRGYVTSGHYPVSLAHFRITRLLLLGKGAVIIGSRRGRG